MKSILLFTIKQDHDSKTNTIKKLALINQAKVSNNILNLAKIRELNPKIQTNGLQTL